VAHAGRFIPVAAPTLGDREAEYVLDCLRSGWISSKGDYVERFEAAFAELCGTGHALACNSGTAALHLALTALGIGPGDEVIVPTMTFVSSANAVRYCGAEVRFVDSLPDTWNLDPDDVKRTIGPRTRAVMPVHLYGEPADLGAIRELAEERGVAVVEDAAEAHGARYRGRVVGGIGTLGAFSFYGNKIITTGEGGMVVTDDDELAERCRLFRGQGQDPERRYWFPVVGFNYRLTNIQCAIGLAQLETLEARLDRRRAIDARYRANLSGEAGLAFQDGSEETRSAHWMVAVVLPVETERERDAIAAGLLADGIESRPFFHPVHSLPPYAVPAKDDTFPVATALAAKGLCLPTWDGLTDEEVDRVSDRLTAALQA
jgi:perosamine synthetase